MNDKTIARAAAKLGLKLVKYRDTEFNETIYSLQDRGGNEVIAANNKKMLYRNLPYLVEHIHTPEAEALAERFLYG